MLMEQEILETILGAKGLRHLCYHEKFYEILVEAAKPHGYICPMGLEAIARGLNIEIESIYPHMKITNGAYFYFKWLISSDSDKYQKC